MDELPSDDELNQAAKNGTIREGTARIHFKLFPKYGFLIPENPLYHGETIFFGLTAHVDASRKFIADLRDELYSDQRVKYMAVPVERDGTVKWKALVVAPLPTVDQEPTTKITTENEDTNQMWLNCKVHPNLQATHGFATPEGCNQYHDNVYFSLREACEGLEEVVSDLTTVFTPGEMVKALVVPADPRFKAKYRALKVRKIPEAVLTPTNSTKSDSDNETSLLVEEMDQSAVSQIYSILENKGSIKLTSLAGDLSRNADVRAVVQPQKKNVKRFLSKYPRFFSINDDAVSLTPDCPPLKFSTKSNNANKTSGVDFFNGNHWSSDVDASSEDNGTSSDDEEVYPPPSPVIFSSQSLKSVVDFVSPFTSSMLAHLMKRSPGPKKLSELFNLCQRHGWEGIKSVAMLAQIVTKNPKYFTIDEKGCVLTPEGTKLSVKQVEPDFAEVDAGYPPAPLALPTLKGAVPSPVQPIGTKSGQGSGSLLSAMPATPFSMFSTPLSSTVGAPAAGLFSVPHAYPAVPSVGVSRRAYTPLSASQLGSGGHQIQRPRPMNPFASGDAGFANGSAFTSKNGGLGQHSEEYVYLSDAEDSFEEKLKSKMKPSPPRPSNHYTEEEGRFLSAVARGICPNTIGGRDEVFHLLRKELEAMGVVQADLEGYETGGMLARHLLCIQLDIGRKPRAKFQVFKPSGKITQTTVSLSSERVSESALTSMLSGVTAHSHTIRVGRLLYGVDKSYHCIRMMTNGMDVVCGCTITFRSKEAPDVRMSDLLELGERGKVRIILSDVRRGTTSSAACASLRKFAEEKSPGSMVVVVDMEGQIFGFGLPGCDARRMICGSLDMQQRHLKETVHHHPNYVIVNAVDCRETLRLLERINARGIGIYAEVAKSLEMYAKNIFKVAV